MLIVSVAAWFGVTALMAWRESPPRLAPGSDGSPTVLWRTEHSTGFLRITTPSQGATLVCAHMRNPALGQDAADTQCISRGALRGLLHRTGHWNPAAFGGGGTIEIRAVTGRDRSVAGTETASAVIDHVAVGIHVRVP